MLFVIKLHVCHGKRLPYILGKYKKKPPHLDPLLLLMERGLRNGAEY